MIWSAAMIMTRAAMARGGEGKATGTLARVMARLWLVRTWAKGGEEAALFFLPPRKARARAAAAGGCGHSETSARQLSAFGKTRRLRHASFFPYISFPQGCDLYLVFSRSAPDLRIAPMRDAAELRSRFVMF